MNFHIKMNLQTILFTQFFIKFYKCWFRNMNAFFTKVLYDLFTSKRCPGKCIPGLTCAKSLITISLPSTLSKPSNSGADTNMSYLFFNVGKILIISLLLLYNSHLEKSVSSQ